jgi:asparagine synthase (glutamine-hydrolysing)
VRGRSLRYLERKLAERYLPPEVLARKKQGFASPLMYILNEEVRRLAPRLLHGSELARDGYLRAERVAQLVREHLEGRRDHGNRIWLLLTAEVWYRHFIGRRSAQDLEAELAEAGAVRTAGAAGGAVQAMSRRAEPPAELSRPS